MADELVEQILREANVVSTGDDVDLAVIAAELAAGVTADREAEISDELPVPYTLEESSTADVDGEKIRVPRMVVVMASRPDPDAQWTTSLTGRKLRRPKADCIVGRHDLMDDGTYAVRRYILLWRRPKT